jgi:hypothetical protein
VVVNCSVGFTPVLKDGTFSLNQVGRPGRGEPDSRSETRRTPGPEDIDPGHVAGFGSTAAAGGVLVSLTTPGPSWLI